MAEHGSVIFSFAAPGALSANWVIDVELAHGFMPQHVSVVGSNASDATLAIGTPSSAGAVLAAATGAFGDSGDPAEYDQSNFADADYQYAKGDRMRLTIDYDGASGTAVQDPCIVIKGVLGA